MFTVKIRISARMYRFSNSRLRYEEIIHGTRIGVTLGEDLQADAEGEGGAVGVKHKLPQLLHICLQGQGQDYGRMKELKYFFWGGGTGIVSYCLRGPINTYESLLHSFVWMKNGLILTVNAEKTNVGFRMCKG